MYNTMDTLRKSLLYRSEHRGTREADMIIGSFARKNIEQLTDSQLEVYEKLLELPDQDLLNWAMKLSPLPAEHKSDVMTWLIEYVQNPS